MDVLQGPDSRVVVVVACWLLPRNWSLKTRDYQKHNISFGRAKGHTIREIAEFTEGANLTSVGVPVVADSSIKW